MCEEEGGKGEVSLLEFVCLVCLRSSSQCFFRSTRLRIDHFSSKKLGASATDLFTLRLLLGE